MYKYTRTTFYRLSVFLPFIIFEKRVTPVSLVYKIFVLCQKRGDSIQSAVGIQDKDAVGQPNFSRHMHTRIIHTHTHMLYTFSWQRKTLSGRINFIIILHYYISAVLSHVLANLYYMLQLMRVFGKLHTACTYAHLPHPCGVTDIIRFHMQIRMMAPT